MTIALLQTLVLEALQKCHVQVHVIEQGQLRIVTTTHEMDVSLYNLHKQVLEYPTLQSQHIAEFISRIIRHLQDLHSKGTVYPRILLRPDHKPISHPWSQQLWGSDLELSLIEHSEGRLTFLTPLSVIQRSGGLKGAQQEALDNLAKLLPQVESYEQNPGIFRIHHPEVLTSSLLLFLDVLLAIDSTSSCWFAVPNRGTLWYGSASLESCLFEIEQDYRRGTHPISRNIYRLSLSAIEQLRQSWQ